MTIFKRQYVHLKSSIILLCFSVCSQPYQFAKQCTGSCLEWSKLIFLIKTAHSGMIEINS